MRVTTGTEGESYAIVMGQPSGRELVIAGLPEGPVQLLGYSGLLHRSGDLVELPIRPDDRPAFALRIG